MLLSIIVPVYNGEKKIARCLDSLMAVKEPDIEFIIVNDGSTDDTAYVCEKYVEQDSRFRLLNKKNGGVSSARNAGLDVSRGKYIGFADADDELSENYDRIINILKTEERSLFGFDYHVQTGTELILKTRMMFSEGRNEKEVLYNNFLTGRSNNVWSNIYRSDIIRKNEITFPIDMRMGEDCVFNARYFQQCQEFYYIKEIGYKYYTDDQGTASVVLKPGYLMDFTKIYESFLMIYQSYENLQFSFGGVYYFDMVYEILRRYGKVIRKDEKLEFRKSKFYHKIMSQRYENWRYTLKKWYIRGILYGII